MDKKPLTRTQRNKLARREQILDVATEMIRMAGIANLSTQNIAHAIDCSVGSIYTDFSCKEELVLHIALRGAEILKERFQRASAYSGNTRERILAIHLTHNSFAQTFPVEYNAFYACKSDGVRERIAEESHARLDEAVSECMNIVTCIVDDAIKNGDLHLLETVTAAELVYNFWALHFGNLLLSRFVYKTTGEFRDKTVVQRLFFRQMLDGLDWQPRSDRFDYVESGQRIVKALNLFVNG